MNVKVDIFTNVTLDKTNHYPVDMSSTNSDKKYNRSIIEYIKCRVANIWVKLNINIIIESAKVLKSSGSKY